MIEKVRPILDTGHLISDGPSPAEQYEAVAKLYNDLVGQVGATNPYMCRGMDTAPHDGSTILVFLRKHPQDQVGFSGHWHLMKFIGERIQKRGKGEVIAKLWSMPGTVVEETECLAWMPEPPAPAVVA